MKEFNMRVKIIPIKREYFNKKGTKKTNWTCDLELLKLDNSIKKIKGIEFMPTYNLKRDALLKANEYKRYILGKGDFYFIC